MSARYSLMGRLSEQFKWHPTILWEFSRFLLKEWPQLNDSTRFVETDRREVYLAPDVRMSTRPLADVPPPPRDWSRWKRALFPYYREDLDDPEQRWKYQKRVWGQFKSLPDHLRRWLKGVMRREQEAYWKAATVPVEMLKPTRRIELQQIGIRHYDGSTYYAYLAYDAPSDTLYIGRHA